MRGPNGVTEMRFANKAEIETASDTNLIIRLKDGEDLMLNEIMARWLVTAAGVHLRRRGNGSSLGS